MYDKLKLAILSKDDEKVTQLYRELHEINSGGENEIALEDPVWMEAICLVYMSYIYETDVYYKRCIEEINKVIESGSVASRLTKNRLFSIRIRCNSELFHFGVYPNIDFSRDRQTVLDDLVYYLISNECTLLEIVNMMDTFTSSANIDHLHNAKNDGVYGFLISQEIMVYKLLKNVYQREKHSAQRVRIEQCLRATYLNILDRIPDFEIFGEEAIRYEKANSRLPLEPSWDVVTLGTKLP